MKKATTSLSDVTRPRAGKAKDRIHLIVEEGLRSIAGTYQGGDYSQTARITIDIDKENDSARINVPPTGSFSPTSIGIGAVADQAKVFKQEAIKIAANQFIEPAHRETHLHLLRLSPYWISALAEQTDILGRKKGKFRNLLILYRIVEICLEAINYLAQGEQDKIDKQLLTPSSLLLRQRYIYLVQLSELADIEDEKLFDYIPGYDFRVRKARESYASLLLDEDKALLVFAEVENKGKPWDLDGEIQLLLYNFSRRADKTRVELSSRLWPFAKKDLPDLILTDTLLRRWLLAHDDLTEATVGVYALFEGTGKIMGLAAYWLRNFYGLSGLGLVLFIAGAFVPFSPVTLLNFSLGWLNQLLIILGIGVGLIIPLLAVLVLFGSKQPLSGRQIFYPLALRVPAMGLVGVMAIAGLMDSLVRYTLNAFDRFVPALFISGCCFTAAFAYILFEVLTRIPNRKKAWWRAFVLWCCGVISTTWLAVITGWLVDPIGLTICQSMEAVNSACITSTYGSVIELKRAVEFLGGRISLDYVILVGAIALLVGVFTQIFWEDKAIAEPL